MEILGMGMDVLKRISSKWCVSLLENYQKLVTKLESLVAHWFYALVLNCCDANTFWVRISNAEFSGCRILNFNCIFSEIDFEVWLK